MTSIDDMLLGDLRRVLDRVDSAVIADDRLAKSAFDWRHFDSELAELVFDSADEIDTGLVVLRGVDDETRQMTFTTGAVTIEVEIGAKGLLGQIVPPQTASIELHQQAQPTTVLETDEFGVFQLSGLRPGPTALVARAKDGSWSVRTSWTVVGGTL